MTTKTEKTPRCEHCGGVIIKKVVYNATSSIICKAYKIEKKYKIKRINGGFS